MFEDELVGWRPLPRPRFEQDEPAAPSFGAASRKAGLATLAKKGGVKKAAPPPEEEPPPPDEAPPEAPPEEPPREEPPKEEPPAKEPPAEEPPAEEPPEEPPKEKPKKKPPKEAPPKEPEAPPAEEPPEEKPPEEPPPDEEPKAPIAPGEFRVPMDTVFGRTPLGDLERYMKTIAATLQTKDIDLEKSADIIDGVIGEMTRTGFLPRLSEEPTDEEIDKWMDAALLNNLASVIIDRV